MYVSMYVMVLAVIELILFVEVCMMLSLGLLMTIVVLAHRSF